MRVVVFVMLCGACSFVLSAPPAAPPAPPRCNPSRFPPIADLGIAFFGVIGTEVSAGVGSLGERSDTGLAVFIPMAAVAAASSLYGFVRTGQCQQAYAATRRYAPPSTPAPPPPFAPPPP